ncbi:MAG: PorV/PorQ family protein [Candidatus Delongbacteria bacterium]|nr:PorV/PorQ family protein [Candidatus Delongbacteria bacterium]
MRNKFLFFIMIWAVMMIGWSASLSAGEDNTKVGTTGASFLEIGVGARAVGMGGAFVAIADDASALYWNPGGISRLQSKEVLFVHTQWLADVSFNYVGLAVPLGSFGTLGGSITTLGMDDMEVTTVTYPDGTGEKFSAGDFCMALTYGRSLTDRFSIGANFKYINQNIWHMNASGMAIDIGTLFTTQFNGLKIGMSISNFGGKLKMEGKDAIIRHDIDENKTGNNGQIIGHLDTDKFAMPLIFRVGLSMDVLKSGMNRVTLATDALHPNDNTEHINVGGEYAFRDRVFLRAGYNSLFMKDSEEGFSAGGGICYRVMGNVLLKLDYAYTQFGDLNDIHRFAMTLSF